MPAGQHQIRQAEQREQLCSVLRQAAVARFPMTKQVLHNMKRMLNFRSDARLQATSKNLCRVRDEVGKILIPT